MDNELYCPMKMTSNPLGRCVCEKEKCAWWNELGSCCSVWWIATELDKIETKIKSESMNEWISVNDSQPKKMESTLLYISFRFERLRFNKRI